MADEPRIIFIHGLGGKPAKDPYLAQWINALKLSVEVDIADRMFRMAYWAHLRGEAAEAAGEREIVRAMPELQRRLLVRTGSSKARQLPFWRRLLDRVGGLAFEFSDPLIQDFLDRFVDDVYTYFYRPGKREQIRSVLEQELAQAAEEGERTALLSHSMGTVIALDVLKDWQHNVDLFVTMGSPLGLEWIRQKLGDPAFPHCVERWLNVFDRHDPVSQGDREIADDYPANGKRIEDRLIRDNFSDKGARDPHHWHGFLSSCEVGAAVRKFSR